MDKLVLGVMLLEVRVVVDCSLVILIGAGTLFRHADLLLSFAYLNLCAVHRLELHAFCFFLEAFLFGLAHGIKNLQTVQLSIALFSFQFQSLPVVDECLLFLASNEHIVEVLLVFFHRFLFKGLPLPLKVGQVLCPFELLDLFLVLFHLKLSV